MDYDGRVVFKIDGDDSGLQKTINNTTNALGGLKSTIVKLGLGALLTKGMKDAVTATNKFESSLAKASTLFGNVSVDTDNLSKKILELSSATGQASDAIGNSLYNALSAGVSVTEDMGEAMSFLESATKLSVAGFTDVDTAVTATAKVMNAYGKEMYDAERIGEILMQTQNLGITTVDQLGSALATVTPVAASFGVSFEQVGASLALMTKQGTDTATATTQLRGMISELGQDGTQASKNLQKAFARAGLEYKNFAEYMRDPNNNLQSAIRLLEEEADSAGLTLSDMFSNVRAGIGALQLAKDETGLYSEFLENLAGDTRLVEDAYAKMMDTRTNKLAKMKEQLKNITIKITGSELVSNMLDKIVNFGQTVLDKFDAWSDSIDVFGRKARLVFLYIKGEYERSPLKTLIDKGLEFIGDEIQDIVDKFKEGDVFGAIADALGDLLLVSVSFKLASGAISGLLGDFTGSFGSLGVWTADALILYAGFKEAQGENSIAKFGIKAAVALASALGATWLTGSPTVGGLVLGVTFKVLGWIWDDKEAREPTIGNAPTGSTEDTHGGTPINVKGTAGQIAKYLKKTLPADVFKEVYTSGKAVGEYLTEGVIDGILSDEEYAKYSVYSFADLMNEALREKEEIHSPSKVWEKYGEFLAEGLAQGLYGDKAEKYAKEAVGKLQKILEDEVLSGDIDLGEAFKVQDFIEGGAGNMSSALTEAIPSRWRNKTDYYAKNRDRLMSYGQNNDNQLEKTTSGWERFLSTFSDARKGFDAFIEEFKDSERTVDNWKDAFSSAFGSIGQGFESLGEALATGEDGWLAFAKAGLEAIATVLEALAEQWMTMAIASPSWAEKALYLAGASTAMVSAGVVRGLGNTMNRYEYGGIVGGHGVTGDRHMIFANAGELILSKAQQGVIASQLGNQSQPTINISFNGQVFGDQQSISEYVYEGIRTAQNNGVLQSWQ